MCSLADVISFFRRYAFYTFIFSVLKGKWRRKVSLHKSCFSRYREGERHLMRQGKVVQSVLRATGAVVDVAQGGFSLGQGLPRNCGVPQHPHCGGHHLLCTVHVTARTATRGFQMSDSKLSPHWCMHRENGVRRTSSRHGHNSEHFHWKSDQVAQGKLAC